VSLPVQFLDGSQPIVDPETGLPTEYFMRALFGQTEAAGTIPSLEEAVTELQEGKADKSTQISAGSGLAGGGDLSEDRTLSLDAVLDNLNDVDTTTTPPTDGQALVYVDADGLWKPGTVSGGGGGTSYERSRAVPLIADFTLQNSNSGVVVDGSGSTGVYFDSVNSTAGIRLLRRNGAPPTTPYSIITRSQAIRGPSASYPASIVLRNSSTGRIIIFGAYNYNQELVQNWSSYTSFNSNILSAVTTWGSGPPVWRKVTNDGTNLSFFWSVDGENWYLAATAALASYISSVDEIGMGVFVSGGVVQSVFQSWEVV
jgi:hypothetical protein